MFKQNKIQEIMKKTYIIPESEVVEIKINQLLMTSALDLIDSGNVADELDDPSDFLAPEGNFDFADDDDLNLFGE